MLKWVKRNALVLRRHALQTLIPEFIWPPQVVLDGVSVPVRNMPYSFGTKKLLKQGGYELPERELIKSVGPEDVVVEMGASIGIVSRILASRAKSVLAFEASSLLVKSFPLWIDRFPNLTIRRGFVFPVWKLPDDFGVAGFDELAPALGGVVEYTSGVAGTEQNKSLVYDLSRITSELGVSPNVLVVDVEGSEAVMLQTRPNFPQSLRDIIIELHPRYYGLGTRDQIIQTIQNEGFPLKKQVEGNYHFSRA